MLAYELLKKAEILTSPSGYITDNKMRMKLRAVTFNNFGCFYKRRGKLHAALQYLAKALKIELTSEEVDNRDTPSPAPLSTLCSQLHLAPPLALVHLSVTLFSPAPPPPSLLLC
jgi:hypothetical protein